MNLEKLFELVMKNPNNISVEYSNINGEEKLTVNGETIEENKSFDDSAIKERVKLFKKNIDILDSCTLSDACDRISNEVICLKELDELLNQDSYSEEESINKILDDVCRIVKDTINNKIKSLNELKDRF